jgi:uncharacterized protein (DUF58 family)
MTLNQLLSPETLLRIDPLELMARTAVEGFLSGLHRSIEHGFGIEFLQYRNYSPGDDLKYLDWKLYARSGRLFSKVYQEETNMNCWILVDLSRSMSFRGTRAPSDKADYARRLAACLAYLANRQGDAVGLITYAADILQVVEPGQRSGQLSRVFRGLAGSCGDGETRHGAALHLLEQHLRHRALVVLISDMLEVEDLLPQRLQRLRTARSDVLALQVLDPDELSLPPLSAVRFQDLETGSESITSPENIAAAYGQSMARFQETLEKNFLKAGLTHQLFESTEAIGPALARFLRLRENLR